MSMVLWELIKSISHTIGKLSEWPYGMGDTPEAKALDSLLQKILAAQRDHLRALEYLYAQSVREKPDTEMTDYAKETLSHFRDEKKLIK